MRPALPLSLLGHGLVVAALIVGLGGRRAAPQPELPRPIELTLAEPGAEAATAARPETLRSTSAPTLPPAPTLAPAPPDQLAAATPDIVAPAPPGPLTPSTPPDPLASATPDGVPKPTILSIPAPAPLAPPPPTPVLAPTAPPPAPRPPPAPVVRRVEAAPARPARPPAESPRTAPPAVSSAPAEGEASPPAPSSVASAAVPGGSASARAIVHPLPEIPDELRHRRLSAVAVVRFRVARDGTVQAELVEGTPEPRLNQAILAAARRWRFFPALREGVPVDETLTVRLPISVD